MLLRAAWRRAAVAVTAAPGPKPAAPTRGLRLRVGDHAPQSAVPADTTVAPEAGPVLRPLYMDVQATTPLDPRVLDAMLPYLINYYGNPHSRTHAYGWESEAAMERARQQVASLIGADPREIIFTSGATESNNIAIKGVARFYRSRKKHLITTQTEHKCVLDSCRSLEAEGFQVTYLPVQKSGIIDLKELEAAIQPDTSLVSVMTVNNEIGVKQPIAEIGQICSSRKVYFHTDAAQAVGKIPLDVNDMKIDLMSISGHKIYGPKGCVIWVYTLWNARALMGSHSPVPFFRFGIGRFTTEEEVDYTVEKCIQHVKRLREMSPLWEMVQDGIDLKSIKWTQH
ncbi:PREDICTED: cysteine desulfurase, mitochondrial [Mandrillus leucophaeus]|uniref:cysteine desulfurase, mitochondrial n=1 Tax=Mandrillus leucophaeus TaxID=9568 RepID=UPI0005F4A4FF|nr:PREDICTED: cysteine desulfurase, mitochondrial [Mandrillus leucophaeus]